jgi:predicted transposase YdaD
MLKLESTIKFWRNKIEETRRRNARQINLINIEQIAEALELEIELVKKVAQSSQN